MHDSQLIQAIYALRKYKHALNSNLRSVCRGVQHSVLKPLDFGARRNWEKWSQEILNRKYKL